MFEPKAAATVIATADQSPRLVSKTITVIIMIIGTMRTEIATDTRTIGTIMMITTPIVTQTVVIVAMIVIVITVLTSIIMAHLLVTDVTGVSCHTQQPIPGICPCPIVYTVHDTSLSHHGTRRKHGLSGDATRTLVQVPTDNMMTIIGPMHEEKILGSPPKIPIASFSFSRCSTVLTVFETLKNIDFH